MVVLVVVMMMLVVVLVTFSAPVSTIPSTAHTVAAQITARQALTLPKLGAMPISLSVCSPNLQCPWCCTQLAACDHHDTGSPRMVLHHSLS